MTNPPVPDDYYNQSDVDYYEQLEYYPSKSKQEEINMNRKYEDIVTVDEYGTIQPSFKLGESPFGYTSGELKYFQRLKGKKVKITLEVVEEEKQNEPN